MASKECCRGCNYNGDGLCRCHNRLMAIENNEPVNGICPLEFGANETKGTVTDKHIIALLRRRSQGKQYDAVRVWLTDQYVVKGMSIKNMAALTGIGTNTLWVKMKKYGIPIRSRSQGQILSIKKRRENGKR